MFHTTDAGIYIILLFEVVVIVTEYLQYRNPFSPLFLPVNSKLLTANLSYRLRRLGLIKPAHLVLLSHMIPVHSVHMQYYRV